MEIVAAEVEDFKRTKKVDLTTPALSVIVGGNNSGKSSLLQGLHFGITVLQSAKAADLTGKSMNTLGYDQFLYKPTGDLIGLRFGGPITGKEGPHFKFTYRQEGSEELKTFDLFLKKGKNANLALTFDKKDAFFTRASNRQQPFSIFVPGLAGIPLREEKRTPSIVTAGIAQGDSNVYLRNVLLIIIRDSQKLVRFHEIVRSVFPTLEISSSHNDETDLYITILVQLDGVTVPLEMVGTGCLQAIQLVAYVTAYNPALLLLDEPDAHLHPSNQRLLASTLRRISDLGGTKTIVATHSRHMFDALTSSDGAQMVWLKAGIRQPDEDRTNLSVLIDLGALDSYELVHGGSQSIVFLTEDTKTTKLKPLFEANGIDANQVFIQPLHGVENISASVPVADFFVRQGDNTRVIVHRDGDCMTEEERAWWIASEKNRLPSERTMLFVTPGTDIEHLYCQPSHISSVYEIPIELAQELVEMVVAANSSKLVIEFSNKRNQLKGKTLKKKENVPSTASLIVNNQIQWNQAKGKTLLPLIESEIQSRGLNPANLYQPSPALVCSELAAVVGVNGGGDAQ